MKRICYINGSPRGKNSASQYFIREIAGLQWRFGIGIGAGEFMRETKDVIPMKSRMKREVCKAMKALAADIQDSDTRVNENIYVNPPMSKGFFMFMGSLGWIQAAWKNKVSIRSLFNKPLE